MARRDFFVQPNQFDPEWDPEGEAPEEVQTLWLQQDVSEWLVCLNNVSLFVCVVTVTTTADFSILVDNCEYYQTVPALIGGLGAVAGSGMVGTDPFTRVSVEAKQALYWPLLLKQSNVKWLAHTCKLTQTAAGTLSLKMKHNYCLFCCYVAGTEYRHWYWFIQPTTELLVCLILGDDSAKHCYLTAGHTELHLVDERPPLRYLLSPCRGGRPMIMTPFVM